MHVHAQMHISTSLWHVISSSNVFSPISSEEDDESEEEKERPVRSTHGRSTSGKNHNKRKNKAKKGLNHIDMTPPEKHLKKSERKAKKYLEKNKVRK